MSLLSRVFTQLLSKDHSVATGLLIALLVWTLTRLVDGVTDTGTIEYDLQYSTTTLDSQPVSRVEVTLTNLSRSDTVTNLIATVSDPRGRAKFLPKPTCGFDPPSWTDQAQCRLESSDSFSFGLPALVPGNRVRGAVHYRGSNDAASQPIVRIRADAGGKLRLLAPGIETWIVRHETGLLLFVLVSAFLLLLLSIGAGVVEQRAPKATGGNDEAS